MSGHSVWEPLICPILWLLCIGLKKINCKSNLKSCLHGASSGSVFHCPLCTQHTKKLLQVIQELPCSPPLLATPLLGKEQMNRLSSAAGEAGAAGPAGIPGNLLSGGQCISLLTTGFGIAFPRYRHGQSDSSARLAPGRFRQCTAGAERGRLSKAKWNKGKH